MPIYIGSISNPARNAVLFHAILIYTMAMFTVRPIISIMLPLAASAGLIFADSIFKAPELMFSDMVNCAFSTAIAIAASIYSSHREINRYILKTQSREQLAQLEQKNRLILDSLRAMEQNGEALAIAQHDELHHLRALSVLCREAPEEAATYAASLISELENVPRTRFTDNTLMNSILTVKAAKAKQSGVRFQAEAILPESLPIPDKDLCTVFMNLIENAVEAAAKTQPQEQSCVDVRMYVEEGCLLAVIKNTLPQDFNMEAFRAAAGKTTKQEGNHGFGMKSAAAILSRYDGELRYTSNSDFITLNTGMMI